MVLPFAADQLSAEGLRQLGSLEEPGGWVLLLFCLLFGSARLLAKNLSTRRGRWSHHIAQVTVGLAVFSFLAVAIRWLATLIAVLTDYRAELLVVAASLMLVNLFVMPKTLAVDGSSDTASSDNAEAAKRDRAAEIERRLDEAAARKPAPSTTGSAADDPHLPAKSVMTRERAAAIEKRLDSEAAREAADKYTRE